jgi:hypothetical protein
MKTKIKLLTVFLAITAIAGCNSTDQSNQESAMKAEGQNQTVATKKLTAEELDDLANNTDFTPAELKAAAKALGYKCTFYAVTGSRIKQKVCSTQEQRDVLAEAARRLMQDFNRSGMAPPAGG